MEITLRESSVEAASPRRRARSAPRDADHPATRPNEETGAQRHGVEASAPLLGNEVVRIDLEGDSARRSAREAETEPVTPLQKKARTAQQQDAGKAYASHMGSPVPWFNPESYDEDLWIAVAKYMSGCDLIRLSGTCRWLFNLLADDSIWRCAFFREFQLLDNDFRDFHSPAIEPDGPHHPSCNCYWRHLYIANNLNALFNSNKKLRFGGFIVDGSDLILTAKLTTPILSLRDAESVGTCILTNARHGVWIIGMQVIKCPGCGIADCKGSMQVLEARHSEEVGCDSLLNEDLCQYLDDKEIDHAFCGMFNSEHLDSPSTADVVNTSSWIGEKKDLQTRSRRRPYAAAINTNVQRNQGLLSRFEVVRDNRKGQVVCVRIMQDLRDHEG